VEKERAPRRWLSAVGGLFLLVLAIGALPRGQADAATPAPIQPIWTINDANGNKVLVDPFGQQFEFVPRQGTPEAAFDRTMRYTRQSTTWHWSDTNRACDATPVPPSRRVARCPVFVWGSIDRVRHLGRATLFKRNPDGSTSVYNISQRLTPFPLPMPPEPAIELQGGRFSPASKTLRETDRVTFQNNSQQPCQIVFDSGPVGTLPDPYAPNKHDLPRDTEIISPGRPSVPFPRTEATPTPKPNEEPPDPPKLWEAGVYRYHCLRQPGFSGTIIVKAS
jgi:hypothetical protein